QYNRASGDAHDALTSNIQAFPSINSILRTPPEADIFHFPLIFASASCLLAGSCSSVRSILSSSPSFEQETDTNEKILISAINRIKVLFFIFFIILVVRKHSLT